MKQTVISVNGKEVSKKIASLNEKKPIKIDKAKYKGYKNPPNLFPVVSAINSIPNHSRDVNKLRRIIMANLNTAASAIKSLASKCQLDKADKAYLENASLWVFSIKDLVVNSRKQGNGVTLTAKKGYITTRQEKGSSKSITLPYFQTTGVRTFAPKVEGDKISAFYSTLTYKEDGHEYPYNCKLNFTFSMCYDIAVACIGEAGLASLVSDQLLLNPNADPKLLLKGDTNLSSWWRKMVKLLPSADLQIQVLMVVDPDEFSKCVVKNIFNSQEKALDFEVIPHAKAIQVVNSAHKEYIWGVDLPQAVVQVVTKIEKQEVTVYNNVDEIPLNSKAAENQLRKLFITFLKENEEYQTKLSEAIPAFLAQVNPNIKLGKWLAAEDNSEKAVKWLSKVKFNAEKATTKQDFEAPKSNPKEERQSGKGGPVLKVIPPSNSDEKETSEEEPKVATSTIDHNLKGTFQFGDDEDED